MRAGRVVFFAAVRQNCVQSTIATAAALNDPPSDTALKILVIDENPIRRAILDAGLGEAGFANVVLLSETTGLLDQVYRIDPDVILIDLENPSRDVLEQMFQVSRIVRRPIAMFVDQSDRGTTEAAVDAGVSAYIVGGLKKERVKDILELCISRFNAVGRLQDELDRTKTALEARKTIDRAKGILIQAKGLSEEQAYALLRKTAMNEKRKIADVAQAVITATELLK
jgi:two-component system, response regulator / RNA-binding antiterminator